MNKKELKEFEKKIKFYKERGFNVKWEERFIRNAKK